MEVSTDEARALKVARALQYIDFSNLERWFGHLGFMKIFQGLKEEGNDLGWTLMLGSMERALAGDRTLPRDVLGRIVREDRITVQHIHELYPRNPPVRMHPGGYRVIGPCALPEEAFADLDAALRGFNGGALHLQGLGEELYRLHREDSRDSLYYHALLTARSAGPPISAHVLWKALRLFPTGRLPAPVVSDALSRLEDLQALHLKAALRTDPRKGSTVLEHFAAPARADPASPAGRGVEVGEDYRARALRFLERAGLDPDRPPGSLTELTGHEEPRLNQLLEPLLLRCYRSDRECSEENAFLLAVGPPGIDKASQLTQVARSLGLESLVVGYGEVASGWAGETETRLVRALDRARELSERSRGRPAMLVLDDAREACPREHGACHVPEVIRILADILTGPRRREALGEGARGSVVAVATTGPAGALDPELRGRFGLLRLEPPDAEELERLLIRSTVGRLLPCDIDRISFSNLAERAAGLLPPEIASAVRRAKLLALERRARELRTRLTCAGQRARRAIRESYLITEEDLDRALSEAKRAREAGGGEEARARPEDRPAGKQTDLGLWGSPIQGAGPERRRGG